MGELLLTRSQDRPGQLQAMMVPGEAGCGLYEVSGSLHLSLLRGGSVAESRLRQTDKNTAELAPPHTSLPHPRQCCPTGEGLLPASQGVSVLAHF